MACERLRVRFPLDPRIADLVGGGHRDGATPCKRGACAGSTPVLSTFLLDAEHQQGCNSEHDQGTRHFENKSYGLHLENLSSTCGQLCSAAE